MFWVGQNLNHIHMTYSFLELLIFFLLTQVDIYCLEFISNHIAISPLFGVYFVPSLHEVRLVPLDANPVFQCLGEIYPPIKLKQLFVIFILKAQ